jgi:8-oxo-dGTP pyrophosphatase MutT (NUDIX family)
MSKKKYQRLVQTSVTNFIHCGDDYLFVKRNPNKKIDPGRLNGIGGRLEPGEDYLHAAIRETEEETGYKVSPKDIRFSGVVKLEGGYEEDWVMGFFKIKVSSKKIPKRNKNEEGEFIWLNKDKVLDSGHKLVDDLYYSFKDVVEGKNTFFITAKVNEKHKIYEMSVGKLTKTCNAQCEMTINDRL